MSLGVVKYVSSVLGVLVSVAFLTLMERKVLGMVGFRLSPLKMSLAGVLQPLGDALKLAFKTDLSLSFSLNFVYITIGAFFLTISLYFWILSGLYFTEVLSVKLDLMMILVLMTLMTLSILIIGWVSMSKFPLIGSIRSATQSISYESIIILVFLIFCYLTNSFSIVSDFPVSSSLVSIASILFPFWLFAALAEMGRTPYDFSEGESELVSGFNTEFGSSPFSLIFLSEYSNILFLSSLTSSIFMGFSGLLYTLSVVFFFIWIRSVLPRSRFDYLMDLAWKFFIPLLTLALLLYLGGSEI